MAKRLIINADDFGKDENSTLSILESFRKGWITQTTLMVNMPWTERAVNMAKEFGFSDKIGLHLNLINGSPLTERIRRFPSFCDENGCLTGGVVRNKRLLVPYKKQERDALSAEIEAQIKKYLTFNLPLMHCDSHCHSHFRLPVLSVLVPLLTKYQFKTIRRPYSYGLDYSAHDIMKRVRNGLFHISLLGSGLGSTEEFGEWDMYEKKCDKLKGSVEIMVHPDVYDGEIVDVRDYKTGEGRPLHQIRGIL